VKAAKDDGCSIYGSNLEPKKFQTKKIDTFARL
jgi:hypothetical protein